MSVISIADSCIKLNKDKTATWIPLPSIGSPFQLACAAMKRISRKLLNTLGHNNYWGKYMAEINIFAEFYLLTHAIQRILELISKNKPVSYFHIDNEQNKIGSKKCKASWDYR